MLVDTSAIYSFYSPEETNHRQITAFFSDLSKNQQKITITDTALEEVVSLVRKRKSKSASCELAKTFINNEMFEIGIITQELTIETLKMFIRHNGKYSYVDCSEYIYGTHFGHKEILAVDTHFADMGLKVLPR